MTYLHFGNIINKDNAENFVFVQPISTTSNKDGSCTIKPLNSVLNRWEYNGEYDIKELVEVLATQVERFSYRLAIAWNAERDSDVLNYFRDFTGAFKDRSKIKIVMNRSLSLCCDDYDYKEFYYDDALMFKMYFDGSDYFFEFGNYTSSTYFFQFLLGFYIDTGITARRQSYGSLIFC